MDEKTQLKRQMLKTDHYDILGISRGSTQDEIKAAYRKMALKYHPDKNEQPLAKEVFKKVVDSYETLTNGNKKSAFEKKGSQATAPKMNENRNKMGSTYNHQNSSNNQKYARKTTFQGQTTSSFFEKKEDQDDSYEKWKRQCKRTREDEDAKRAQQNQTDFNKRKDFQDLLGRMFDQLNNAKKAAYEAKMKNAQKNQQPNRFNKKQPPHLNLPVVIILFLLVFTALSSFGGNNTVRLPTRQKQTFSLTFSPSFNIQHKTPILKTRFFAQQQPTPEMFIQVDKQYIKIMQIQCQESIAEKQKFTKLAQQSEGAIKKLYRKTAKDVEQAACVRLSHLNKRHSQYIKGL